MNLKIIPMLVILLICMGFTYINAQDIPSSHRSQQAIARVKADLIKELEDDGLKWGEPVFIRIFKKEKKLEVWVKQVDSRSHQFFKTYNICSMGFSALGPKLAEGDRRVPEGFYFFRPINLNPNSNFYLSFNIGYPNQYDRYHGRTGSAIMVHGSCRSSGCFAMTDKYIEEIYALVDAAFRSGQSFVRVHIFPFNMTERQMNRHRNSIWFSFWENLKTGHDLFISNGYIPPNITVRDGVYVFN